jgi:hypothetical protein
MPTASAKAGRLPCSATADSQPPFWKIGKGTSMPESPAALSCVFLMSLCQCLPAAAQHSQQYYGLTPSQMQPQYNAGPGLTSPPAASRLPTSGHFGPGGSALFGESLPEHHERRVRLSEFNIYPTFSFLGHQTGYYNEFEFASHTDFGDIEMENRTVLNVADLPDSIQLGPTNPDFGTPSIGIRGNGFGDVLSGFFFSRKHRNSRSHLGIGPVITFPSATNPILGSGQWTIGPGAHFSTEVGRLTTGFFIWQSWGLTDDPGKKRINQLFGKPFLIYELSPKWNLVYIPLGLSHSWKSPAGDDWTVPLGGGIRRLFKIRDQKMGFQFQAFDYVARKPKDPEWELRMTIEFLFD